MKAPRTSIRRKLVTAMVLTSTAVLVLAGAVFMVHDFTTFRHYMVQRLVTRADILAANSTAALAFENSGDAAQVLHALRNDPSTVSAALYDSEGNLFATYPANAKAGAVPGRAMAVGSRFAAATLSVAEPVVEDGRRLGTIFLQSDLRELDQRIHADALVLLLSVFGSIVVAFALSSWLQRRIAKPILALAEVARTVSEGKDYSVRSRAVGDDEVGALSVAFDEMLGEIQRRESQIRLLNADLERRVNARTAELEASNKELEAFSYSVSHDLRAPLRHIDGFVELLIKHASASLDEKARGHLTKISNAAQRMGALIDDLLVFSRMGRTEMRHAPVDLAAMTADVVEELRGDAKDRCVEWSVGTLPIVHGDPSMLRQVLVNLLANALKYSGPTEKARIEVDARAQNGEVIVWVRDNGVGFDPAYGHKLFGVFQRLHGAHEFEGTGIGLANVRRIVTRHGGRTWAEGAVHEGATFYFSLPRSDGGHS